jgi:hypothetical protein
MQGVRGDDLQLADFLYDIGAGDGAGGVSADQEGR